MRRGRGAAAEEWSRTGGGSRRPVDLSAVVIYLLIFLSCSGSAEDGWCAPVVLGEGGVGGGISGAPYAARESLSVFPLLLGVSSSWDSSLSS